MSSAVFRELAKNTFAAGGGASMDLGAPTG
jgi:hypothetical protein